MLQEYEKAADEHNVLDILKDGADAFVNDLLTLPKPKSKIIKSGYTHLVDTFSSRINKNEVEVGWGKYYGPMVEHGTVKMSANPHLSTLFDKNKEKYYKTMKEKMNMI